MKFKIYHAIEMKMLRRALFCVRRSSLSPPYASHARCLKSALLRTRYSGRVNWICSYRYAGERVRAAGFYPDLYELAPPIFLCLKIHHLESFVPA